MKTKDWLRMNFPLVLIGMLVIILVGLIWTPYDPNAMSASAKMAKPSLQHLLGADNFGRDIFSRVVEGAGATFLIATASVAIGLVIATPFCGR